MQFVKVTGDTPTVKMKNKQVYVERKFFDKISPLYKATKANVNIVKNKTNLLFESNL